MKTKTQKIIDELKALGMQIGPRPGGLIACAPKGSMTPEIMMILRRHKRELKAWMTEAHLIRQIFAGEFGDCTSRAAVKVAYRLSRSQHPLALRALEHLLHSA